MTKARAACRNQCIDRLRSQKTAPKRSNSRRLWVIRVDPAELQTLPIFPHIADIGTNAGFVGKATSGHGAPGCRRGSLVKLGDDDAAARVHRRLVGRRPG